MFCNKKEKCSGKTKKYGLYYEGQGLNLYISIHVYF